MGLFSFEEAAKELASFGLTGNQARAYISLVKLRVAPVSKIAKLSKIRREEVYRMMPKLERLGLVEKVLGKPIKYKSVPPKEGLSILFKRERESADRKIAELAEKRRHLLKQLKSVKAKRTIEEGPHFALILDREQALRRIMTMVRKAKKSIAIATPMYAVQFGYTYADVFRKAVRKEVKAKIILNLDELNDFTFNILREAELFKDVVEVRHTDNLTSHIVIVDNTEVIVGTFLRPTAEKHIDLWTNSPAYVGVMRTFFDRIWQDSVDVKSRIEYLQTGKPIERTEVIKGRDKVSEGLYAILSKTNSNLFMMTDSNAGEFFKGNFKRNFMSATTELKKRGVRIRLLTNIDEDDLEVAVELTRPFEVRHLDQIPMRAVLGDEEIQFSWTTIRDLPEAGIYSNNPELVRVIWEIAEKAWNNSADAQSRIDEIRKEKSIGRVSKPIMEYK